jgi:hypothetical protein
MTASSKRNGMTWSKKGSNRVRRISNRYREEIQMSFALYPMLITSNSLVSYGFACCESLYL